MNKIVLITVCIGAMVLGACSNVKRKPGRVYMPDMAYSRAVETYNDNRVLQAEGINYTALPVPGTVSRGEEVIYKMLADTTGGYVKAPSLTNPLPALDSAQAIEAERLYLVNCGICHGGKLDGNGPLYKGGEGPFPAAPKNFLSDEMKKMADGTYFYSVTYGKGMMGSYASQLSPKQRWMVIRYIRGVQGGGATAAPAADSAAKAPVATAKADSSAKK